ncbi:MAG: hypothetical protein JWM86_2085, partial [Thermoleophilia bacterium]|nr:hypothetical protein [Thermoleophilia bacterium]
RGTVRLRVATSGRAVEIQSIALQPDVGF